MPNDMMAYEWDGAFMANMLGLYWDAKCKAEYMLLVAGA